MLHSLLYTGRYFISSPPALSLSLLSLQPASLQPLSLPDLSLQVSPPRSGIDVSHRQIGGSATVGSSVFFKRHSYNDLQLLLLTLKLFLYDLQWLLYCLLATGRIVYWLFSRFWFHFLSQLCGNNINNITERFSSSLVYLIVRGDSGWGNLEFGYLLPVDWRWGWGCNHQSHLGWRQYDWWSRPTLEVSADQTVITRCQDSRLSTSVQWKEHSTKCWVSFIISLCVVSIGCTCSVVLRTPAALQDKQTLQALSDCGCSSFTVSLLHHPAHHSPSSLAAVPVFTAECICREIRRLSLCLPSPPQSGRAGAGRSVRWSNTSHHLQPPGRNV